jgi:hypothetical protein
MMTRTRHEVLAIAILTIALVARSGFAAPPGFVKTMIPLAAPPAGLAFDTEGTLFALEGASFGRNVATLRTIHSDGSAGNSFPVVGHDPTNFFVGGMAYDPLGDRLLITDNTADGRLYAVDQSGVQQTLALGIAGIAGVAVRDSGEIFVSTAPFGSTGAVLQIDRAIGSTSPVLGELGFGAGLAFDQAGDLIVQDANATTFRGRLQQLPITETSGGLVFGAAVPLLDDMQSSAGLAVDSEGNLFTTGNGGLFQSVGNPLVETAFDANGNPSQFATAIAFDPGSQPFERFGGPEGGRLAYMGDFGFATQDTFVTMLTPARPGDYNTDGAVDEADYTAWRSAFGSTIDLAADGNGDQVVDAADYVLWRENFQPAESGGGLVHLARAPEPATLHLLLVLAPVAIRHGRDRSRRKPAGSALTQAR